MSLAIGTGAAIVGLILLWWYLRRRKLKDKT